MVSVVKKFVPSFAWPFLRDTWHNLIGLHFFLKGLKKGKQNWKNNLERAETNHDPKSDLEVFFDNRTEGAGIWKWRHYFDIYEKHFNRFRGKPVRILEIGIYSGGSLDMWKDYFGTECTIYGIDIEDACKVYEDEKTHVFIGDQADRNFWSEFKKNVEPFDIIIDDGGHKPIQQLITLEEALEHLNPGGVYLCEDIAGKFNSFHAYVNGLSRNLHGYHNQNSSSTTSKGKQANPFQKLVKSIHSYPYVTVIEANNKVVNNLNAPRHGTLWQPFFNKGKGK